MPVVIRQLTIDDAELFRTFRLAALRESPASFGASAAEEEAYTIEKWRDRLGSAGSAVLGAFGDEGLVGTLGYFTAGQDGRAWLWTMYVAPAARGLGLARRLLDQAAAMLRAAGHTRIYLTVTAPAAAARALYAAYGFRTTEVRPNQLRHSGLVLDVEEMSLALDQSG